MKTTYEWKIEYLDEFGDITRVAHYDQGGLRGLTDRLEFESFLADQEEKATRKGVVRSGTVDICHVREEGSDDEGVVGSDYWYPFEITIGHEGWEVFRCGGSHGRDVPKRLLARWETYEKRIRKFLTNINGSDPQSETVNHGLKYLEKGSVNRV